MPNYKTLTEEQLIVAVTQSDNDAINEIVLRTKDKLYTAIYIMVKDSMLAEDLMQDTYIKAIEKLKAGKYVCQGKVGAWLSRIAHNICIDHFRLMKRTPLVTLPDGKDIFEILNICQKNAEHAMEETQSHNRVRKMLELIPQEQREVIFLRMYANMSFKEISESTNTTLNTCLGRMRYGLINLRKIMAERQLVL